MNTQIPRCSTFDLQPSFDYKLLAMSEHETLTVQLPSDRNFGTVFTIFFAVSGLLPLRHGHPVAWKLMAVAGVFLGATLLVPKVLHPLNWLWAKFGSVASWVVTPVVMGVVFFGVVVPTGMLLRMFGRDVLARKMDPAAQSYWIRRTPQHWAESMREQF